MKEQKSIGQIIKQQRQLLGLTQEDLSNKLFVSRQTISNWESEKVKPDYEYIIKLSKIFNISVEQIDCSEEEKNNISLKKTKGKLSKVIKIFISAVILLLLVITILLLILIDTNTIEVYVGNIDSDQIKMSNTIFIKTNEKISLYLGTILNRTHDDDLILSIYSKQKDGNLKKIVQGTYRENYELSEYTGYNEYFDDNFDINNLFIELENPKDETKLNFKINFVKENRKTKLFYKKEAGAEGEVVAKDDLEIIPEALLKNDYKQQSHDKKVFEKQGNPSFLYDTSINDLNGTWYNVDKEHNIDVYYKYSNGVVSVDVHNKDTNEFLFTCFFNNKREEVNFYHESCGNYVNYVDLILEEFQKIVDANKD